MTPPKQILLALVVLAILLPGCEWFSPAPGPPNAAAPAATGPAPSLPAAAPSASPVPAPPPSPVPTPPARPARTYKVAHVFVALCDNRNQGIIKVPAALGNGQDPAGNLYWGARYGVKTFFARSADWTALEARTKPGRAAVLERALFRSKAAAPPLYVVADAYDGAAMPAALADFLSAAAGLLVAEVETGGGARPAIEAGGRSDLVAFVGHNGLMDMGLAEYPATRGGPQPSAAVVLACKSRDYFVGPLRRAACPPLITTRQFMAPEAYTLDAALRSWAAGDPPETVRRKVAAAYAAYQRCSPRAAEGVFVAGWGQ